MVRRTLLFISLLSAIAFCGKEGQQYGVKPWQAIEIDLDSMPDIKILVEELESAQTVESEYVNVEGRPSLQYARFQELKKRATTEQLKLLTDHKSPVVRCYAFHAFASKKDSDVFPVLLKHLSDTAIVSTLFGCIGDEGFTGDYFINVVTPGRIDLEVNKLDIKQRKTIDSILLYDKSIRLFEKLRLLWEMKPTPQNYLRIKELVVVEKNEYALMALARHRKQEDKNIIASFLEAEKTQEFGLRAVCEFPDAVFFPEIVRIFESEWESTRPDFGKMEKCIAALAKYPRPETVELFRKIVKRQDEFKNLATALYLAIELNSDAHFKEIGMQLKLDEFQLNEVAWRLEELGYKEGN